MYQMSKWLKTNQVFIWSAFVAAIERCFVALISRLKLRCEAQCVTLRKRHSTLIGLSTNSYSASKITGDFPQNAHQLHWSIHGRLMWYSINQFIASHSQQTMFRIHQANLSTPSSSVNMTSTDDAINNCFNSNRNFQFKISQFVDSNM